MAFSDLTAAIAAQTTATDALATATLALSNAGGLPAGVTEAQVDAATAQVVANNSAIGQATSIINSILAGQPAPASPSAGTPSGV
jgi:hypothetical protein